MRKEGGFGIMPRARNTGRRLIKSLTEKERAKRRQRKDAKRSNRE